MRVTRMKMVNDDRRKREVNHAAVINPQPCVISLHKSLKGGLYTMGDLQESILTSLVFHSLLLW